MKTIFTKGQDINAGNFIVNIGTFDTTDIAIISKSNGRFTKLKQAKVSKRLRKVKKHFKSNINNDFDFVFQFMVPSQVIQLIKILRS
jgi:hypothetical protein